MARPRKPTAVLEASGAFKKDPKRGRARASEPKFTLGVQCPSHLCGTALKMWTEMVEQLDAINLLQRVDGAALEAACIAYQTATAADRALEAHGLIYEVEDKEGNVIPKARPEVAISRAAWAQYKAFCTEFGLTPASRSRLGGGEKQAPKTLREILDAPGCSLPDLKELGGVQ